MFVSPLKTLPDDTRDLFRTNIFLIKYGRRCSWLGRSSIVFFLFRDFAQRCWDPIGQFSSFYSSHLVHFSKCSGAGIPRASDLGRIDLLGCRPWAHDSSRRGWSWFDPLEHDGGISLIYIRSSHKFVPFFERLYILRLFTYLSVSFKKCNPALVVQLLPIFHYSVWIIVFL